MSKVNEEITVRFLGGYESPEKLWGSYTVGKLYKATIGLGGQYMVKHDDDGVEGWFEDEAFFKQVSKYGPWKRSCDEHLVPTVVRHEIKTQKTIASIVLEQLAIIDEHAIVAGGAPRNWDMNKPANDIDVYFYAHESRTCEGILRALKKLFGEDMVPLGLTAMELSDVSAEERKDCPYDSMDIRWVFEGNVMGVTVQFIAMKNPTFSSVVQQFDSSICKIWFDGRHIVETPEYKLTKSTGIIFIKDPEGRQNRHLSKMYAYYKAKGYVFTNDAFPNYNALKLVSRDNVTPWEPSEVSSEF